MCTSDSQEDSCASTAVSAFALACARALGFIACLLARKQALSNAMRKPSGVQKEVPSLEKTRRQSTPVTVCQSPRTGWSTETVT